MVQLYQVLFALVFNATDLLTGIVYAVKEGILTSSKLRDGLFKKCGFLVCYFLAYIIDTYGALIGFSFGIKVLNGVIVYAVFTEMVSIVENIHRINPDLLPEQLLKLFHVSDMKEGAKNDED